MKTKYTYIILFTLLATLLGITGCNADASAGLFRQISESTTPVGIKYEQILGKSGSDLYFTTTKGIFKTDGTTTTQIKVNSAASLNRAAYVDGTNAKVAFIVNDSNNAVIKTVPTTPADPITEVTPTPTFVDYNPFTIHNLYANGLFMIQGTKPSPNGKSFSLATFNTATSVLTNVVTLDETHGLAEYSLESVLQQTGKDNKSLSATDPMILSFATTASDYKHFYVDGTNSFEITLNRRLANFSIINSKLYILATDGRLYGSAIPSSSPHAITDANPMIDITKIYDVNAFMYAVSDGTNTHIITKSNSKNDPLYIVSFPDTTITNTSITTKSIRSGYAEYLDSAEIVSTYEKSPNSLLVATAENGMFDIDIVPGSANQDSSSNGTSSVSEAYTF